MVLVLCCDFTALKVSLTTLLSGWLASTPHSLTQEHTENSVGGLPPGAQLGRKWEAGAEEEASKDTVSLEH